MFLSMYYCREPPCTTFWDRRWTWERSVRQFLPKISRSRYWMVHFLPNYCTLYTVQYTCPPACLSVYEYFPHNLSKCLPYCLPACLFICRLRFCWPTVLPSWMLTCLVAVYQALYLPVQVSICLTYCLTTFLSISCLSVCQFTCLPVYQLPISLSSVSISTCLSTVYITVCCLSAWLLFHTCTVCLSTFFHPVCHTIQYTVVYLSACLSQHYISIFETMRRRPYGSGQQWRQRKILGQLSLWPTFVLM